MAFPIYKLLIVSFRYASRPLNQLLVRTIKSRGNGWKIRQMFEKFGQMAHVYEIKINRYIVKEESALKPGGDD